MDNRDKNIDFDRLTTKRKIMLIEYIEKRLPKLIEAADSDAEVVLIHQDAFAADYQSDEYTLLGMFIKYWGLRGKEVRIIGTNRETLKDNNDK